MKKRLFSLLIGSLVSGSQVQATIYAAEKLTKDDQTVYLLSDVDGETADALMQKQIILDKVKESEAALIARDPCDIRRMKKLFPEERKSFLKAQQAQTEAVASDLKTLRQGLITLAYKHAPSIEDGKINFLNINIESVAFMQGLPLGEVKKALNDIVEYHRDQLQVMSLDEQKNFWQHVVSMNKIDNTCISLDQKRSLTFLIARLEQLVACKGVKLASAKEIVVCSTPEDIECLAFRLSKDGWKGDTSHVGDFSASWGATLDAEDKQRLKLAEKKYEELNKLNAAIKKLKNKASRERLVHAFNKRWESEFQSDPIKRENEVALKCSKGPVDLKAFFAGDVSEIDVSHAASSSDAEVVADASIKHVLELQNKSDMQILSPAEKSKLAQQVFQELMPILTIKPEHAANELVTQQIYASELMAYFYMHAQEYERACRSLCNAIGLSHNNGFDEHTPHVIGTLVQLMQTPMYKQQVLNWMLESGFDDEEQTSFVAELERAARCYGFLVA